MPLRQRARPVSARRRRRANSHDIERIEIAANGFIVGHYPIGFLGGTPRRLAVNSQVLWLVPILLTSTGYGAVGEVGLVAIDATTGEIVGSTPRSEAVAEAKLLREAKRDELEAAFHRARTV